MKRSILCSLLSAAALGSGCGLAVEEQDAPQPAVVHGELSLSSRACREVASDLLGAQASIPGESGSQQQTPAPQDGEPDCLELSPGAFEARANAEGAFAQARHEASFAPGWLRIAGSAAAYSPGARRATATAGLARLELRAQAAGMSAARFTVDCAATLTSSGTGAGGMRVGDASGEALCSSLSREGGAAAWQPSDRAVVEVPADPATGEALLILQIAITAAAGDQTLATGNADARGTLSVSAVPVY